MSSISKESIITANGGQGTGNGLGGSGGIIILDGLSLSNENVQSRPGSSLMNNGSINLNQERLCRHGAPGIIYKLDSDSLTINSEGTLTRKRVYI